MTPLELQVIAGLLKILSDLNRVRTFGGGLSAREEDTYFIVWMRLDQITAPERKKAR